MKAWLIRGAILCVWLVLLMALARRQSSPSREQELALAGSAEVEVGAREEWMSVLQSGRRIGYSHRRVVVGAEATSLFEESLLNLKVLDAPRRVRTVVHAQLDSRFALRQADFSLTSEATYFSARATTEEASLRVDLDLDGTPSTYKIDLSAPIFLPQAVRASLREKDLKEGTTLRAEVWDPVLSRHHELVTRVLRREPIPDSDPPQQGWRIEEDVQEITTTAWLDDHGHVVREEGPLGLVLVRATRDAALADIESAAALDVGKETRIAVATIAAPRSLSRLRLRVSGADRIVEDAEQSSADGILTIERKPLSAEDTYPLPWRNGWKEELGPTLFLQSDHPRLQRMATEIAGGERDAQQVARLLNAWVYDFVQKTPTLSVPNALQVLDSGRGDCNEHAVLLAALARSLGLPAKVVAGVVYLDGSFQYHAWCELWLNRWVAVDPAFDQIPADATHLKLMEGDPDRHALLLGVVDKLRIEVENSPSP